MPIISVMPTPPVLAEILENKRREVERAKRETSTPELAARVAEAGGTRDFVRAVTTERQNPIAVIAEIKRKSPSAGWIRARDEDFDPSVIASAYASGGASAISCLTDDKYFGGSGSYIQRIRDTVNLPVLRKDFLIDPWQVDESRSLGADAILLIGECLDDAQLAQLADRAVELDMAILFEAHDRKNLDRLVQEYERIGKARSLIGINNRDLTRMVTDLEHSVQMANRLPDRSQVVSESGIRLPADLDRLHAEGISIVLVGEGLMREPDPGSALTTLLSPTDKDRT